MDKSLVSPYNNLHTRYHKIHARSRTEAKWGVFWDGVSLPYRYETEDTYLAALNKRYLPDYLLTSVIGNVAAEIKGKKPTDLEQEKCHQLCYQEGYPVLLINGSPYYADYNIELFYTEYDMLQCKVCEKTLWLDETKCDRCGNSNPYLIGYHWGSKVVRTQEVEFQQYAVSDRYLVCAGNLPLAWSHLGNALQFAFRLASHARFEFLDNWKPSLYDGNCEAINPAFQTQDWTEAELLYNCLEGRFPLSAIEAMAVADVGITNYISLFNAFYYPLCSGKAWLWEKQFGDIVEAIVFLASNLDKLPFQVYDYFREWLEMLVDSFVGRFGGILNFLSPQIITDKIFVKVCTLDLVALALSLFALAGFMGKCI